MPTSVSAVIEPERSAEIKRGWSLQAFLWRAGFVAAVVCGVWLLSSVLAANATNLSVLAAYGPNWWYFGLAAASFFANQAIAMVRWLLVARAAGVGITVHDAITLGVAGEAGNLVMPGANGGDAVKLGLMVRAGLPAVRLTAVSVADRVAGLMGLLALGLVAGLCQWGTAAARGITACVAVALACCGIAVVVLLQPRAVAVLHQVARVWPTAGRLTVPLAEVSESFRRRPVWLLVAVLMSVVSQSFSLMALYLSGMALLRDDPADMLTTFLVGPLVLVSTALPLPFGALGVTEQMGQDLFATLGFAGGGVATLGYRLSHTLAVFVLVGWYGLARWLAPQRWTVGAEHGSP